MELDVNVANSTALQDEAPPQTPDERRPTLYGSSSQPNTHESSENKPGWFMDLIRDLIVDNPDSPGDLSTQHEHYRLGTPKR